MPDDPRAILRAAGVECEEVEDYMAVLETEACPECGQFFFESEQDFDAILALAKLVAEYKWIAEHDLQVVLVEGEGTRLVAGERSFQEVYDLGEFYREKHDA